MTHSLYGQPLARRAALRRLALLGVAALTAGAGGAAGAETAPVVLAATQIPPGSPGFNGAMPGPQLRVRRGEAARIHLINRLDEPLGLAWQGVRLPDAVGGMDGALRRPLAAGATADIAVPTQEAGTFLYRAWTQAGAARRLQVGLAGLLIVEDVHEPEVDHDIGLLVCERPGSLAPTPLVNGQALATITMRRNQRARLRLANAGDGVAVLAFAGVEPVLVALDGRPVNTPFVPDQRRLDLPPGGRADVMVDAVQGDGEAAGIATLAGTAVVEIVRFVVTGEAARPQPLAAAVLPATDLPAAIDLARARRATVDLGGAGAGRAPLLSVRARTPVQLALRNDTDSACAVIMPGHAARRLHQLDDGWEPYWLDTVPVPPRTTAQVAFVADNPGKWLLDAQTIGQPELRSLAWFEVQA